MARKTEFELEVLEGGPFQRAEALIIGRSPADKPYVNIDLVNGVGKRIELGIKDRDLERFAVNILKALNSPKLKK